MHVYCTYGCTYIHMCMYACICMYCMYMQVCVYMHVCIYVYVFVRLYVYTYMNVRMYMQEYVCIPLAVKIYMCIYVHIRTIRAYAYIRATYGQCTYVRMCLYIYKIHVQVSPIFTYVHIRCVRFTDVVATVRPKRLHSQARWSLLLSCSSHDVIRWPCRLLLQALLRAHSRRFKPLTISACKPCKPVYVWVSASVRSALVAA